MKSNVGRDIAAENGSAVGPVALHQHSRADAKAACDALCSFLQGSLAAAQESIEHTLSLQQEMMDVVSRHVFGADGSGQPGDSAEDMQALVSALQSDDLIRQNYENLARALAVMSWAAGEAHALAGKVGPDQSAEMSALRSGWTANMLNALLLDEMRQRFSRKLDNPDGSSDH